MITSEPDDEGGLFLARGGPLRQWSNGAGSEDVMEDIILNTVVGGRDVEYHLVRPSQPYGRIYENVYRMVYMSNKIITELCRLNGRRETMKYKELVKFVEQLPPAILHGKRLPGLDKDMLLQNAEFLVTQVRSFEDAGDQDEDLTIG